MKADQIERALDECHDALSASNCPFNEWEKEFIESVKEQYDDSESLSQKQQDTLERIWGKI